MDRASCEQPLTSVTATTPAVNMLLSLMHGAACGQSSYAAPASSSLDPPPAGGHVDTLSDSTFVLTVTVSVKLLIPDLHEKMQHHHGNKRGMTDASIARMRGSLVVLPFVVTVNGPPLYPFECDATMTRIAMTRTTRL